MNRLFPSMLIALFALLLSTTWTSVVSANEPTLEVIAEQNRRARADALMTHGINTTEVAVGNFLRGGFTQSALSRGLPQQPEIKTEIVLVAIQEAGFSGYDELVPDLRGIIQGEFPEGILRVIRRDLEGLPLQQREQRERIFRRHIQFAAVIALGYIGDPEAAADIHALIESEGGIGIVREGSLSLGLMGDERAIGILANALARHTDPEQQADLFSAVFYLTGRNYGVREVTSLARRREAVEEFSAWTQSQGGIDGGREDIFRRRHMGPNFPDPPLGSLRGSLRAVGTFGDFERRYAARQHLRTIAPDSASELKAIVEDPLEDLDIRQQAMQWYAATEPREARQVVRRLRDDENPSIRQAAERLLPDIDQAIDAEGGRRWGLF